MVTRRRCCCDEEEESGSSTPASSSASTSASGTTSSSYSSYSGSVESEDCFFCDIYPNRFKVIADVNTRPGFSDCSPCNVSERHMRHIVGCIWSYSSAGITIDTCTQDGAAAPFTGSLAMDFRLYHWGGGSGSGSAPADPVGSYRGGFNLISTLTLGVLSLTQRMCYYTEDFFTDYSNCVRAFVLRKVNFSLPRPIAICPAGSNSSLMCLWPEFLTIVPA